MAGHTNLQEFEAADILCASQECIIGSGGYGVVLVGHKRVFNKAAIKVFSLTGEEGQQAEQQKKFLTEINSLVKASHENIAQVFGWVKWLRAMGIVMQYYKGGNIRQFFMRPLVQIEIALRLRMIAEICGGIAFIHNLSDGKGLVHSNIKPENVLLTEDLHCKLADIASVQFATIVGSTTHNPVNQKENQYNFYYTAPEKLKNPIIEPMIEHDTFSFAVVVHLILTCLLPYPLCETSVLINEICNGKRPDCEPIEKLKQTLDSKDRVIVGSIEKEMIQCWHHNASQRPDMITVREKFDRLLEKQNPSTVLQQVVNAVSQIDSNENPSTNQDQLIPLHHFSTCLGQFQEPTESSNVYDTLHKLSPSTHSEFHYGFMAESQPKAVQISDERRLVETYMKCVENHRYEEADAVKHLLVKMIESQGEVSPEQMVAFADKHRLEGSFMQAMLIYQISLDFYDKYSHLDGSAEGVMGCVGGLHLTGMGLLEDPRWFEFFKNKRIVRDFVIPLMSNARRRILNLSHVSAESRCLCEAWCLHYIECAQNRIGDNRAREETLNLAVVLLRKVFGDDAAKYQVYGHLLNNYGFVCTANSRIGDALTFYLKAVEAYSMAEDLTPEEKKERVERSTKNLQEVASQR